jgi:hypothetical protein
MYLQKLFRKNVQVHVFAEAIQKKMCRFMYLHKLVNSNRDHYGKCRLIIRNQYVIVSTKTHQVHLTFHQKLQ